MFHWILKDNEPMPLKLLVYNPLPQNASMGLTFDFIFSHFCLSVKMIIIDLYDRHKKQINKTNVINATSSLLLVDK